MLPTVLTDLIPKPRLILITSIRAYPGPGPGPGTRHNISAHALHPIAIARSLASMHACMQQAETVYHS